MISSAVNFRLQIKELDRIRAFRNLELLEWSYTLEKGEEKHVQSPLSHGQS